ncbi:MAG: hypothetical protein MZV64_35585 [Ignavibacteriales bacterium]|nr:hypothetical protein [Ignavibacteriales bacterium]
MIGSLCCSSTFDISILSRSIRGGVPVFRRPLMKPSSSRRSRRPEDGGSLNLPPRAVCSPVCMIARMNVPAQRTKDLHATFLPSPVITPSVVKP